MKIVLLIKIKLCAGFVFRCVLIFIFFCDIAVCHVVLLRFENFFRLVKFFAACFGVVAHGGCCD